MFRSVLLVVFFTGLIAGVERNRIPPDTEAALIHAETYELLSLDPDREPQADRFHGWHVLGRIAIGDNATRTKLNAALLVGVKQNKGIVAGCFRPRHGIHVTHKGKVHDVVMCFECLSASVYVDGQRSGSFLVSESPQPVFDEVLQAAGVPLAGKSD